MHFPKPIFISAELLPGHGHTQSNLYTLYPRHSNPLWTRSNIASAIIYRNQTPPRPFFHFSWHVPSTNPKSTSSKHQHIMVEPHHQYHSWPNNHSPASANPKTQTPLGGKKIEEKSEIEMAPSPSSLLVSIDINRHHPHCRCRRCLPQLATTMSLTLHHSYRQQ